jgi:hypothetical protein
MGSAMEPGAGNGDQLEVESERPEPLEVSLRSQSGGNPQELPDTAGDCDAREVPLEVTDVFGHKLRTDTRCRIEACRSAFAC